MLKPINTTPRYIGMGAPQLLAPQRPSSVNATQNFWQAGPHSWMNRAQQPMGRPGISRWFSRLQLERPTMETG